MTEKQAPYRIDPEGKVVVFLRSHQFFVGPDPTVYGEKEDTPEDLSSVVHFIRPKHQ